MDNLYSEGLTLMVFGMGFVFVFLTLLVVCTSIMSRLVGRYLPEPAPRTARARPQVAARAAGNDNDELIAVLTAAVHKHRSK
ncbi:MAG: OadG family protein [Pseudomonadota bacterium]|jgi:oxaloacetate decarboxylase gamma subunit|nr:OadG family protein [Pseudomonadota bacterium]